MRLSRRPEPFDSDEYIFKLKIDGFRSLAYENGQWDTCLRHDFTPVATTPKSKLNHYLGTSGVNFGFDKCLPDELLKPFLTEHTILRMLELILKSFATGRNLEKTFGQDVPGQPGGLRERHAYLIAGSAGRQ